MGRWVGTRGFAVLLLVAAGVVLAYRCAGTWAFTVDDAYIVFRYARNLAEGFGPTFNREGPPIEGYTQALWVGLMALPHLAGVDVVVCSKALGVLFAALTLLATFGLARTAALAADRPRDEAWLAGSVAAAAMAVLPVTAVHVVAGLGTMLFTWLLLATAAACARFLRHGGSRPTGRHSGRTVGLCCLLLGLARAEGNAFAVVAVLLTGALARAGVRGRFLRSVGLFYVLPAGLYFALRWTWFGLPMPLPFYVKVNGTAFAAVGERGLDVAGRVFWQVGLAWIPTILLGLGSWRRGFLPAAVAGLVLFALQTVPVQIMGYGWRFLFPALPIAAVAAGVGVARVRAWRAGPAFVIALALVVVTGRGGGDAELAYLRDVYAEGLRNVHVVLGERLAGIEVPGRRPRLALGDAGAVPYLSGWETFDTFGLNEPETAVAGRHEANRVIGAAPDVLVLISKRPVVFEPWLPWEAELWERAREAGYIVARALRFNDNYFLWVTTRREGPVHDDLRAWKPARMVR